VFSLSLIGVTEFKPGFEIPIGKKGRPLHEKEGEANVKGTTPQYQRLTVVSMEGLG